MAPPLTPPPSASIDIEGSIVEKNLIRASSVVSNAPRRDIFESLSSLQTTLHSQIYNTNRYPISPHVNTQRELVSQINDLFRHQQTVNKLQLQFASANYVTNMANFAKTRNLENVIANGRKEILSLTKTISTLRDSIDSLNQDIGSQKQEAQRLEICLKDTQEVLKRAIIQYRRELDAQKALIESQGAQLERLALSRLRADLLIDSCLLLTSLIIVKKTFLRSIIKFLVRFIPLRFRMHIARLTEFISILTVFMRARHYVSLLGFHGSSSYQTILSQTRRVTSTFLSLPDKPFSSAGRTRPQ